MSCRGMLCSFGTRQGGMPQHPQGHASRSSLTQLHMDSSSNGNRLRNASGRAPMAVQPGVAAVSSCALYALWHVAGPYFSAVAAQLAQSQEPPDDASFALPGKLFPVNHVKHKAHHTARRSSAARISTPAFVLMACRCIPFRRSLHHRGPTTTAQEQCCTGVHDLQIALCSVKRGSCIWFACLFKCIVWRPHTAVLHTTSCMPFASPA